MKYEHFEYTQQLMKLLESIDQFEQAWKREPTGTLMIKPVNAGGHFLVPEITPKELDQLTGMEQRARLHKAIAMDHIRSGIRKNLQSAKAQICIGLQEFGVDTTELQRKLES